MFRWVPALLEGVPQSVPNSRILPPARYPVRACCTAESTFLSVGNLTQPFCATIRSPTQTVNSPRSPSTNSGCIPNSCLINSATRAALGGYDAQTLQNRMRTGCIARPPIPSPSPGQIALDRKTADDFTTKTSNGPRDEWLRVRCNEDEAIAVNIVQRHYLDRERARRQVLLCRNQPW